MDFERARKLRTIAFLVGGIITLWLVLSLCLSLIPTVIRGSNQPAPVEQQSSGEPLPAD